MDLLLSGSDWALQCRPTAWVIAYSTQASLQPPEYWRSDASTAQMSVLTILSATETLMKVLPDCFKENAW